jgi:uncharacterized protein
MITNATIMNKKLYDIIKKNIDIFQSCQLSIDGTKDIQDKYRVYKNGSGTFDTISKNISYWKELFKNGLNIHGVLNKNSIPYLYDSYIFFIDKWNVKRLWFIPAKDVDFDNNDVEIYKQQIEKIYNYIMSIVEKTRDISEIQNYAPLDRALRNNPSRPKPCGAGNNYATITADGEIYPCHHLYFVDSRKETKIGDVFIGYNPNKKLIWDAYDDSDMIGCDDCKHNSCYRCFAENYEKYLTPFKQIRDYHCGFMMIDFYFQNKIKEDLKRLNISN